MSDENHAAKINQLAETVQGQLSEHRDSSPQISHEAGRAESGRHVVGRRVFWLAMLLGVATLGLGIYWSRGLWAELQDDKGIEELLADCQADDDQTRVEALLAIGRHPEYLPRSLEGIFPNLMKGDEGLRLAAETAVRSLGKNLLPDLQSFLQSSEDKKFLYGCILVTILGPEAREYIPLLIEKLDVDDYSTRLSALFALEVMGKEVQPAFDKFVKLLDVPKNQFNLQVRICNILSNLGEAARPAIPQLMKLADEGVPSARTAAYVTLGMLGPSPDHDILGLLTKRLDEFYLLDRERALIGLGYLGEHAKPALGKIEVLMGDPKKSCQAEAAYAYWKISGETERPLKVLAECLESYDFRMAAVERAGDMGPLAVSLLPKMLTFLEEPDELALHEAVINSSGQMGPAAKAAIPNLKAVAEKEEDYQIRETVRKALELIQPKTAN